MSLIRRFVAFSEQGKRVIGLVGSNIPKTWTVDDLSKQPISRVEIHNEHIAKMCGVDVVPRKSGTDTESWWSETDQTDNINHVLMPFVPSAVWCVGLNYVDHAKEAGLPIPERPIILSVNKGALQHPNKPVVIPKARQENPDADYEAELGIVIGSACKNATEENALQHVIGFTAGNDVTARRMQATEGGGQWSHSKSYDTWKPIGPSLLLNPLFGNTTTKGDLPYDPQQLTVQTRLNGELMQDSNTNQQIAHVARVVSFLSAGLTLEPGTLILTGTPKGVGFARKPPIFLKDGDVVDVSVDWIGTLTNNVEYEK